MGAMVEGVAAVVLAAGHECAARAAVLGAAKHHLELISALSAGAPWIAVAEARGELEISGSGARDGSRAIMPDRHRGFYSGYAGFTMPALTVGALYERIRPAAIAHVGERSPRTLYAYMCGYDDGLADFGADPLVNKPPSGLTTRLVRAR